MDQKGLTPAVAKLITDILEEIGYSGVDITLKTDQETSIIDLKREVGIKRQARTTMVESPVRESKCNGAVERSVRTWQSQFRTCRHQLEARLGTTIRKGSAMMSWLVAFTSEVLSKFKVHVNRRTTYEMTTGHRFKHSVYGFGVKVHFKMASEKTRRNKVDTEWDTGCFLGCSPRTTECLVGNASGVMSCITMRRLQDDLAYDAQCLQEIEIGYGEYVCKGAMSTNPRVWFAVPLPEKRYPAPMVGPAVPRRVRIAPQDLRNLGYTDGFPGCDAAQSMHEQKRNHSEA